MKSRRHTRPRPDLPPTATDRKLALAGWLAVLVHIRVVLTSFDRLPPRIPVHFDFLGLPDRYADREHIWWLVALGVMLQLGTHWAARVPHTFNYLPRITPENAAFQYRNSILMIRVLTLVSLWSFLYITYGTIRVATGLQPGLGGWFAPAMLLATFGTVGYFTARSLQGR